MKIEYKVRKPTEYKYGYLTWRDKERKKYEKLFPKGDFKVILRGKELLSRKVDWKQNRVCLYPLRKHISKGDLLILSRAGNRVHIRKER